jgi:cysteine protease ATG4
MVRSFCNRALYTVCSRGQLHRSKLTFDRALTNGHESSDLRVYITGDGGDVYEDSFMEVAKPDGNNFIPTLILVGTRLGVDKITPVYWEALKASLQMPQSIGIAG